MRAWVALAGLLAIVGCTQPVAEPPPPPMPSPTVKIVPHGPRKLVEHRKPPHPTQKAIAEETPKSQEPLTPKTVKPADQQPVERQLSDPAQSPQTPVTTQKFQQDRPNPSGTAARQEDADQTRIALAYRRCVTSKAEAQAVLTMDPADDVAIAAVAACDTYEPQLTSALKSVGFNVLRRLITTDAIERIITLRATASGPASQTTNSVPAPHGN